MFEKVNPSHPDKVADRIGGAIVDLGYTKKDVPKIAGECMLGHGNCHIIIESDVDYKENEIADIVKRIAGKNIKLDLQLVPQDVHLADNQKSEIRCGDNGIFKGAYVSSEENMLTSIVKTLYELYPTDGKYIYDKNKDLFIACQSHVKTEVLKKELSLTGIENIVVNPLGDWTGGPMVDTGCCNRKLGSDMGRGVTGGGLHFKDISKADVSLNIYLHAFAKKFGKDLYCNCAIGDEYVEIENIGKLEYKEITKFALDYINKKGGFEKFAEWGLID